MQLPLVHVVDEREMVRGVPVQAVAVDVEGDGVNQLVDGCHDLEQVTIICLHFCPAPFVVRVTSYTFY